MSTVGIFEQLLSDLLINFPDKNFSSSVLFLNADFEATVGQSDIGQYKVIVVTGYNGAGRGLHLCLGLLSPWQDLQI